MNLVYHDVIHNHLKATSEITNVTLGYNHLTQRLVVHKLEIVLPATSQSVTTFIPCPKSMQMYNIYSCPHTIPASLR